MDQIKLRATFALSRNYENLPLTRKDQIYLQATFTMPRWNEKFENEQKFYTCPNTV